MVLNYPHTPIIPSLIHFASIFLVCQVKMYQGVGLMVELICSNEIIQFINNCFAQNKYIYVMCDSEFGKLEIGTEMLEVTDDGVTIIFEDINGFYLALDKYNIRRSTISEDDLNEILTIDCGDLKISFIANK